MVSKDKVKVQPNSVKAADPGVAFLIYTETTPPGPPGVPPPFNGPAFDCALDISISVTDGTNTYSSTISVVEEVYENKILCLMPFGDPNWPSFIGHLAGQTGTVTVTIDIDLVACDSGGKRKSDPPVKVPTITVPNVAAQSGTFSVSVVPAPVSTPSLIKRFLLALAEYF